MKSLNKLAIITTVFMLTAAAAHAQNDTALLLFGGMNHETFLSCLNCSQFDSNSIANKFGVYGSSFSSTSIFNHFSEYGSTFSTYSACNSYATDPPVIVDSVGRYYGRLTLNGFHPELGVGGQLMSWLSGACS